MLKFDIEAQDGRARQGALHTRRGIVRTPAFMPVGTSGSVKGLLPSQVREAGADIILGNCYHLMLRPGAQEVAQLGGLHKFMRWDGPILTDSGGYQVMSLAKLRRLDEDGVRFQSHLDGQALRLTPERSMEVQHLLGADIQMVLDECLALPAEKSEMRRAMELSLRWAERSKLAFGELSKRDAKPAALFGIQQGGTDGDLREASARGLQELGFDGYAIGGLAVGEGQAAMLAVVERATACLPATHPRYLMGVGTPDDLVHAVAAGVDMFDCVLPTRSGRHGLAYGWFGKLNLRASANASDARALDEESSCPASRDFARAYLHHLFKANELLGQILLSWHNVAFYQELMAAMRAHIAAGKFADFVAAWEAGTPLRGAPLGAV